MYYKSKICHHDKEKAIVRVTGWNNNINMGTAFGEASSIEEAEDRAIERLIKRESINYTSTSKEQASVVDKHREINLKTAPNDSEKIIEQNISREDYAVKNNNVIPNDWSEELSKIDNHLQRLSWSRKDENLLVKYLFECESRARITSYDEIKLLMSNLVAAETGNSVEEFITNLKRKNLISASNNLINNLNWNEGTGRDYLKKEFSVSSRNELSLEQLEQFNESLVVLLKMKDIKQN